MHQRKSGAALENSHVTRGAYSVASVKARHLEPGCAEVLAHSAAEARPVRWMYLYEHHLRRDGKPGGADAPPGRMVWILLPAGAVCSKASLLPLFEPAQALLDAVHALLDPVEALAHPVSEVTVALIFGPVAPAASAGIRRSFGPAPGIAPVPALAASVSVPPSLEVVSASHDGSSLYVVVVTHDLGTTTGRGRNVGVLGPTCRSFRARRASRGSARRA